MVLVACRGRLRFDIGEVRQIIFITGTDTGVGKTVLTALLTQFLRERGVNAVALKPIGSGGRADAQKIREAMGGALALDEINPWHFRAPVAPLLAARRENQQVSLSSVLAHLRAMQKRFDTILVEGAGGLLSPLGENFNSLDLMTALRARPVIVALNRLGVVNHALLTLAVLPKSSRAKAQVVLVAPSQPDASTPSNALLLAELSGVEVFKLPRLGRTLSASQNPAAQKTLCAMTGV